MLRKMITMICIFFKTRKKGGEGSTKKTNVSNTDKKFKIKSKNSDLNIKAGEF